MKIDVQKIVDRLRGECFEVHRGAFWWDEGRRVAVAFGNDGYSTDEKARREVAAVRQLLVEQEGRELGFATDSEDGYCWALACELPADLDPAALESVLWDAWLSQCEAPEKGLFRSYQSQVAGAVLERHGLI